MKKLIYFDNASTTIDKPKEVIEKFNDILKYNFLGNPMRNSSDISLNTSKMVYDVRKKVSNFFKLNNPNNVAFTHNATFALNLVLNSLINTGDYVVTTSMEHNSVLRPLYFLETNKGIMLNFVGINSCDYNLDIDKLFYLLKKDYRRKFLVLNHISNVTGVINDIYKISEFCKNNGIYLIIDGTQSAGVIDIDFSKDCFENVIYCFTSHKSLYSITGTGVILVKGDFKFNQFISGGLGIDTFNKSHNNLMPYVFEAGTLNFHSILFLGLAIDYINNIGIKNIESNLIEKINYFEHNLKKIKNCKMYSNINMNYKVNKAPITSINIGELSSDIVAEILNDKFEIIVRSGYHCAPLIHNELLTKKQGTIRFSLSIFNTISELDIALEAIEFISKKIKP